jgi:hypothetical protein
MLVGVLSFNAAAVPELLVYRDRLFIYWSALAIDHGRFKEIDLRGAQCCSMTSESQ